jgi:hypothetical protein
LALEHYRALSVKQVQMDTLSHLVLSRASAFSLAAVGDITLMTEIVEASQVYISNAQDVRFVSASLRTQITPTAADARVDQSRIRG